MIMNPIDYALLGVLLLSILMGAMRGLLREAIALVSWLAALIFAWTLAPSVEPYLGQWVAQYPQLQTWLARAIVATIILVFGAILGAVAGYFIRLSIFSGLDRLLGTVFGALRGVVILGVLAMLGQQLHLDAETWWKTSVLMPSVTDVADFLRGLVD
jgi:membrane protein required for colicin V production